MNTCSFCLRDKPCFRLRAHRPFGAEPPPKGWAWFVLLCVECWAQSGRPWPDDPPPKERRTVAVRYLLKEAKAA